MTTQKFSRYLSLGLIVSASILTVPKIVNAGEAVVGGSNFDSTGYSGVTQETIPQIAPDTTVVFDGDSLNISADMQKSFEKIADELREEFPTQDNIIISLIFGKEDVGVAAFKIEQAFVDLGAEDKKLVGQLTTSLSGILPDCQSGAAACQYVNINKLSTAINSYNQLVKTVDPKVLIKLKENPYFKDISKQLRQLRQALAKS
ncbi:MAG: hypothetical protein HC903_18315 [Methylacidiphilales bacterium]|nr:hypothetical protein [Candidatus Methylacidiphilales bacterium]